MTKPIISVRNLTKSYRLYAKPSDRLKETLWPWKQRHTLFHALNDVSFDVYPGEHLGIVGQNGAGKSTLLQILTGVLTPTSGKMEASGRITALLELGAGFNPELTGRENVIFQMQLAEIENNAMPAKLEEVQSFADIGNFFDQPMKLYSSGMFTRVAFASAILTDPDIFIVDEILAVGDAFFQQKCLRRMQEYRKRGTILYVSHDTTSVAALCDRALWLENGNVREYGPAKEVCERYMASSYTKAFANVESIRQAVALSGDTEISVLTSDIDEARTAVIRQHCEKLHSHRRSDFTGKDSFGEGGAHILQATLDNLTNGNSSPLFTYDDVCRLVVYFDCSVDLSNAIVGFIVKDRLGKSIFGTNSSRYHSNWTCRAGEIYAAVFEFKLPDFITGEYILTLAVAEGTLQTHRQLHWIHDAMTLQFTSQSNDGTVVATKCTLCTLIGKNH